jgi:histidinol-phosphatase
MIDEKEIVEYYQFGQRVLDKTRALLLDYCSRGFSSELKADETVVTEADKAVEEVIRGEISLSYPSHSILGEEFGDSGSAPLKWIIDPIDGTANFLTGIPTFGTILALFHGEVPLLGFSDHPLLGRRYCARKGAGVFLGEKKLRVRGVSNESLSPLENIAVSSRKCFAKSGHQALSDRFFAQHPSIRVYRDVFAHGLTAEGCIGGMVEWANAPWDLAVARIFAEEAGGSYFEFTPKGFSGSEKSAIFGASQTVELLKEFFAEAIPG